MKKLNLYAIASLLLCVVIPPVEGTTGSSYSQNMNASRTGSVNSQDEEEDDEYEILERDQVDRTDTYEIPLGDSEVEDEEEANLIEGREVFHLPKPR